MPPAYGIEFAPYLNNATVPNQPKSVAGVDLNVGLIDLRGALTTIKNGVSTQVNPQLVSRMSLADNLTLQNRVTFANWNNTVSSANGAVETSLTARSKLPLVNDVVGAVGHDGTGASHRSLRINAREKVLPGLWPALWNDSLKLQANATLNQTSTATQRATSTAGVEAALVQQVPADKSRNSIGIKYATSAGQIQNWQQSTIVSHVWTPSEMLRLGVEYELKREAVGSQNAVRFTWRGYF